MKTTITRTEVKGLLMMTVKSETELEAIALESWLRENPELPGPALMITTNSHLFPEATCPR